MAIIVNGTNIPTSGNNIKVGNTDITKVNVVKDGVTATVWERVISITPPASEVMDYININGDESSINAVNCSSHPNDIVVGASVWSVRPGMDPDRKTRTNIFTITPKYPYTKISCAFHKWGLIHRDYGEDNGIWVNGVEITDNMNNLYSISNVPSITIQCYAKADGDEGHWKTEAYCCIYNVTLS